MLDQMSLLPVPDDWEANDAGLTLTGELGMHPDVLNQFDLGDRIEITVVGVIAGAGFKEKEVKGFTIKTVTRAAKLEGSGNIRRAVKDTSVFRPVAVPDSLDAALSSQTTVDALADAALGATDHGIESVEVSTSSGTRAKRTRAPRKPPENVDPETGEVKEPPAAAAEPPATDPPAAAASEDAEALTDLQMGALRVLAAEPGCDLDQFQKSLSGVNGSSYDTTEAKAIVDLLIRRGLVVLTEHNDYELSASGEAAIVV